MSKKEESKGEAPPPADARVKWIEAKLAKAYESTLKADKFAKAFADPEALVRIE